MKIFKFLVVFIVGVLVFNFILVIQAQILRPLLFPTITLIPIQYIFIIPSIFTLLIGWILWKKMTSGASLYVLGGGVIVGLGGFILGFFGPMIFAPEANQGPLLGIFITGPLGLLIGLIGGGIFWSVKKKGLSE